jgi:hypothetical protein
MTTVPHEHWKKSSYSDSGQDCVEVSNHDKVRDSKNPTGPALPVSVAALVQAVKKDCI